MKLSLQCIVENEFEQFVKNVRKYIKRNQKNLLKMARTLCPEAEIVNIELTGSYAKGIPNEDSDIDLTVYYTNASVKPQRITSRLYGKLSGYGGVYDIIPKFIGRRKLSI